LIYPYQTSVKRFTQASTQRVRGFPNATHSPIMGPRLI
jgi:hypothetical protein